MIRLSPLLVALAAAPALAQDAYPAGDQAPTNLDGVGRITVEAGYRLTSNNTLYDSWYGTKGPGSGLERAPQATGAPVGTLTFAYAVSDLAELGIDLMGTSRALSLSEPGSDGTVSRKVSTLSYGLLIGLRFQGVLDVGPQGLVPFAGLLTGPVLVSSKREGSGLQENVAQAWGGSLGATLRLSSKWGLTAEYRLMFLRGPVESPDKARWGGPFSFSSGGNWFSLGVTYTFPPDPSRPLPTF